MDDVLQQVREELLTNADPQTKASGERFFKEAVRIHGVKSATVTALASKYFNDVRTRGKDGVFSLCDNLWRTGYLEESGIACHWSYGMRTQFTKEDFLTFQRWVAEYVSNWAACDTLCNHTVGAFVEMYPECLESLKQWALSENRWMRRAAAVSLIVPARRGRFLDEVFAIADILLRDADDLVQKGYGWMLKSASQAHQAEVFDYVMRHKAVMPRTALRYAIEKMPPDLKAQAMAR